LRSEYKREWITYRTVGVGGRIIASKMELNETILHGGDYEEFGLGCDAM
jgi:hypothetical protein